jgi:hypothetical protein
VLLVSLVVVVIAFVFKKPDQMIVAPAENPWENTISIQDTPLSPSSSGNTSSSSVAEYTGTNNNGDDANANTNAYGTGIRGLSPVSGAVVPATTLIITGQAQGYAFEGSFPIQIYNNQGILIATTHTDTVSDWMTAEYVPFSATLNLSGMQGLVKIVLMEDDPSGGESGQPAQSYTFFLNVE